MKTLQSLLGLVGLLATACATAPRPVDTVPARADSWFAEARAVEPEVTTLLTEFAERRGGDLTGLEHRFKTRDSLERKISTDLLKDPSLTPADVVIDDALRYTLRVDDVAPGHHVRVVRELLSAFEARGHRVVEVKNYWPGGDAYSGVNSVLVAPGGLTWELQIHTPLSFAVKSQTHAMYEIYRLPETPAAEKRMLFAEMAALWFSVPIPAGILRPGALHSREEIILRK